MSEQESTEEQGPPAGYQAGQIRAGAVALGAHALAQQISHYYGNIIVRLESIEDLPPAPGPPPFKGLAYYTEADAPIFFGREEITRRLLNRLQENRFLAIVGASGSGKSSLLHAGLIPNLRRHNWAIHTITPGTHPLRQLAATLTRDDPDLSTADEMLGQLQRNPDALARAADRLAARGNRSHLLLAVDQFEELFTQCKEEATRRHFLALLLTAATAPGAATILLAIRADFYDHCLQHPGLRARLASDQEPLGPLTAAELLRVIAEPARRGGWQFVEGLVEQILDDVGEEPGRLPLLSHALLETWEERRGTVMTLAGYRRAGGVEGAIATSADQFLADHPAQVPLIRRIFLALTELGEGAPDTRRVVSDRELARLDDHKRVADLLDGMVRARLVSADQGQVQVAHEALIRRWPTLQEWLAENRERLRFERQLARDARQWQELNQDPGGLYRGARLAQALAWQEEAKAGFRLDPLSQAFIRRSREAMEQEEREREAQRQRELAIQQALAMEQQQRAEEAEAAAARFKALMEEAEAARQEAERQAHLARARELVARSGTYLPRSPLLALSLAWQAADETYATDGTLTAEAYTALQRALALPTPCATLRAHQAEIWSVAFNPPGDRILTTSGDGTARVWDLEGRELLRVQGRERRSWYAARFNPAGDRLLTASSHERTVRLWDLAGNQVARLTGHESVVYMASFGPAGKRILTGSRDGSARLWNLDGEELARLVADGAPVRIARFDPQGERLLTAGEGSGAHLWDLDGNHLAHLAADEEEIISAHFDPDGQQVLTLSAAGRARLWDLTGREIAALGRAGNLLSVRYRPGGGLILTTDEEGTARLWDMTGEEVCRLVGHEEALRSADFHPAGNLVLTCGEDGTARLWDLLGNLLALIGGPWAAQFDRLGKRILAIDYGFARLWDLQGQELARLAGSASVTAAAISPAGDHIVTANSDGTSTVWIVAENELARFSYHQAPEPAPAMLVTTAVFCPSGDRVLTAGSGGSVRLWHVQGQELARLEAHQKPIDYLQFNQPGNRILTAGYDGSARLWDLTGREVACLVREEEQVISAMFNPAGDRVLTASAQGTVYLWDLDGNNVSGPPGAGQPVAAWFNWGGDRIITIEENVVVLWDLAWRQVARLEGDAGPVTFAYFNLADERLLTTSAAGTACLWDAGGKLLLQRTWPDTTLAARGFNAAGDAVLLESHNRLLPAGAEAPVLQLWQLAQDEVTPLAGGRGGFNRQHTLIFTVGDEAAVTVYDQSGQLLAELSGHESFVNWVESDRAGRRLLTASADGTARVWDLAGNELVRFKGHQSEIYSAVFNPAGDRILTAGADGTARLWRHYPSEEALWAAGRERLRHSPLCRELFGAESCPEEE